MKAERLRGGLHGVAVDTATAICTVLEPARLSIGGGTVLAARWEHRQSTDIDFFCEAAAYAELDERRRTELEEALRTVPGIEGETLWSDPIATWCTVRDTEVTILPRKRVRALAATGSSYLDSMRIAASGECGSPVRKDREANAASRRGARTRRLRCGVRGGA